MGFPSSREDQADEPGAVASQFRGTFVTEDVKGGQDCGAQTAAKRQGGH